MSINIVIDWFRHLNYDSLCFSLVSMQCNVYQIGGVLISFIWLSMMHEFTEFLDAVSLFQFPLLREVSSITNVGSPRKLGCVQNFKYIVHF